MPVKLVTSARNELCKNLHVELGVLSFITIIEAVVQRCSVEKVFLEILQNSQENTCAREKHRKTLA